VTPPFAAVYQSARRNDSELVFSFLRFSKGDVSSSMYRFSTRPCSLVVMFPRAVLCGVSSRQTPVVELYPNAFDAQAACNGDTVRLSKCVVCASADLMYVHAACQVGPTVHAGDV